MIREGRGPRSQGSKAWWPEVELMKIIEIKCTTNQRRWWHPTPVLLPGKSHGRRSLVGCSPWGREESDTTERLHFHFSLSCIGEGHGNPLQCSCLENPRDGGAWWAAVYGVAQSQTRLKQLSSSSSSTTNIMQLNHPETILYSSLWKNYLPPNQSLVPRKVGAHWAKGPPF